LCLLAAASCAPHPQLAVAPDMVSTEWQAANVADPVGRPVAERGLADTLGSDDLKRLAGRALAANADIAIAAARLERARADLRIARSAMLPIVSAGAGLSATRSEDKNASLFSFSEGFASADISFDLDLFGQGKARKRAERARYRAASFDRDSAALVVEAEMARAFVQYAALTDRIALLDRMIANGRELERILGVRLREGAATRVDTGLQAIDVRGLEADRLRLTEARIRTGNAVAVLAGEEAPVFHMPEARLDSVVIPALAPAQPGELLVRRPDIQAAEARIAAADGDVSQARRAFLPSITLSARALGQAATLSGPIGSTLAAGAALLAPIFDRARLNGRLDSAAAAQHESVELYRKALLTALAEAENALASVDQSRQRQLLIGQTVEEARTTARLARLQYLEGEADLRDVLDAERLLAQAEDANALSTQERLNAVIDLYEAMGGSPNIQRRAAAIPPAAGGV
jgi:NodT family efflux transporter outer membrane factor (OMF) lipoprotein